MNNILLLDAGPLGRLARLEPHPDISYWFDAQIELGRILIVPEIADYEVRRDLIQAKLHSSLDRLDALAEELVYLPINTETMRKAALFWAQSRQRGKPTSDRHALDADAILAAQAVEIGGMVITENPGHLQQWVSVKHWRDF